MTRRKKSDLKLKSVWDESLLQDVFTEHSKPFLHAYKIWHWIFVNPSVELVDVPMEKWGVPRAIEQSIKANFVKMTSKVIDKSISSRGDTIKLLIQLQDGHKVETVVMRHEGRTTVCVSSQIGCKMGCKFCATGTMGIIGDLTSGEIIEQLIHASAISRVRNVVFMGMGEPLNNFSAVKLACEFMIDTKRLGLSPRQITVSTVGVVNNMYRLTEELPTVSLALSLHAPTQEIRLQIVPAAAGHPLDKLMAAVDHHIAFRMRRLSRNYNQKKDMVAMIEYILISDVNDREEHAHLLGQLLAPRRPYVLLNLIPYNPTEVSEDFKAPTKARIDSFFDICTSPPYSIYTRIRQEMGQDIDGACGQLALVHQQKGEHPGHDSQDIEDMVDSPATLSARGKTNSSLGSKGSSSNKSSHSREELVHNNSASRHKRTKHLLCSVLFITAMASFHPIINFFSRK